MWHLRGRDRDLVVDAGNGIGDLRGELTPRPPTETWSRSRRITISTTSAGSTSSTSVGVTRTTPTGSATPTGWRCCGSTTSPAWRRTSAGSATNRPSAWSPRCRARGSTSRAGGRSRRSPPDPRRGGRRRPGRSCLRGPPRPGAHGRIDRLVGRGGWPAVHRRHRGARRSALGRRRGGVRGVAAQAPGVARRARAPATDGRSVEELVGHRRAARRARLRGAVDLSAEVRVNTASAFVHLFKPNRTISDRHEPAHLAPPAAAKPRSR